MAEGLEIEERAAAPYEPPQLRMHESIAEGTKANIAGISIDNSFNNQGKLILNNTSL